MLIPKGNDLWSDLRISFIDVDKLMLFLKRDDYTGYVKFEFTDTQGLIFLQEGDVVNGVKVLEEERKGGQEAVQNILTRAQKENDGLISIAALPTDSVAVFSEVFQFSVKLLYHELSSDFSHLGQFVTKLKNDSFTGYVEVHFPVDRREGIIFLVGGKLKAIVTEKIQIRLAENNPTDLKFIRSFIEGAQRMGVVYDTFEQVG